MQMQIGIQPRTQDSLGLSKIIGPTSLAVVWKIEKKFDIKTRLCGLIYMHIKEH